MKVSRVRLLTVRFELRYNKQKLWWTYMNTANVRIQQSNLVRITLFSLHPLTTLQSAIQICQSK